MTAPVAPGGGGGGGGVGARAAGGGEGCVHVRAALRGYLWQAASAATHMFLHLVKCDHQIFFLFNTCEGEAASEAPAASMAPRLPPPVPRGFRRCLWISRLRAALGGDVSALSPVLSRGELNPFFCFLLLPATRVSSEPARLFENIYGRGCRIDIQ
ncbi:hypothetical protein E2C01_101477 [Portunus trituberculatus]|uniref:Uncharacterized protein n=1 Tax=Portunus trituberculatus TaxID=210409 RepID=A0A5B7KG71_PORTR|nr:hypothetical protein [Portunus trituberculatus]